MAVVAAQGNRLWLAGKDTAFYMEGNNWQDTFFWDGGLPAPSSQPNATSSATTEATQPTHVAPTPIVKPTHKAK
jgi:hypothetical protein